MKKTFSVADIFCGCGGLSFGFSQHQNFNILWANDIDKEAILSYKKNHPNTQTFCCDIAKLKDKDIENLGEIDILLGGPPCQSYSTLGKRKMDDRANLFREYLRILKLVNPKIFIFENVVGLLSMQKKQLFSYICEEFKKSGYHIQHSVLNSVHYGVPQIRERVIVVGISETFSHSFTFPKPNLERVVTLKEAIGDLPQIKSGENGNHLGYLFKANNDFLRFVQKAQNLTEHESPKNNPKLIAIMETLQDGQTKDDLPISIRPKSGYVNTYAKMWWNAPAPTITRNFSTPSSSRCIHPRDSRALSIREGARLQSFPDDYIFCGSSTSKKLQIGNAVPPLMSLALSNAVFHFLQGAKQ
ncbi:DNA cytosine methyltransferase [Helicobacter pametensis]|uniref:DNA cytosine methyltransferase n=1 Tax=Helicobacter pametensis TaxID=95149 RepID=UPI0004B62990|nr:DNA cytosine methyltransferase [Helicobacter pametensis]